MSCEMVKVTHLEQRQGSVADEPSTMVLPRLLPSMRGRAKVQSSGKVFGYRVTTALLAYTDSKVALSYVTGNFRLGIFIFSKPRWAYYLPIQV